MTKKNRITVSSNKDKSIFGISIPLDIDNENNIVNNIEKIKFTYIKYAGIEKFSENGYIVEKYFIQFTNMPIKLIEELVNVINNEIDDVNNKQNIFDIVNWIVQLFSKHKFNEQIKKIFNSDFSEALFMIICKKKFNFDISKYYQKNKELFIFSIFEFNKKIEIKSCNKANSKVIFDKRSIMEKNNKDFFTVEFKYVLGKTNILQIYKEIGFKNTIIKEKYDDWEYLSTQDECSSLILERKTVDIDTVNCFKISLDSIPNISISNDSCVEKIEITLNVIDSKNNGMNDLLNMINQIELL